jgi:hypothetical protein
MFLAPSRCTPRTPSCGIRRAEKDNVCEGFWRFSEFYAAGNSVSRKGGKSVSTIKKTVWKNNTNFVKDVPMIYVRFITILVTLSEKKQEAQLSYRPPYYRFVNIASADKKLCQSKYKGSLTTTDLLFLETGVYSKYDYCFKLQAFSFIFLR